ncbi:hypothetical protein [Nocardioides speluncae]|uniref:hypothetical protein n=1 Tax=Nocardioides speluncae TaxID=2670337 RepID=UPI000D6948D5|nr:hypothetical protein [Nocardioides speluncae]
MTIEDTLRQGLSDKLDTLDVPHGDAGRALREGDRGRGRQRHWRIGIAVATGVALVCAGVAVGLRWDGSNEVDPAPTPADWTRLPEPPLSPRTGGVAAWTGSEALFVGGEIDNLCPPGADCSQPSTYARDGAAYDPVSGTWRRIADAPVTVAAHTPHAMVGDNLVIIGDDGLWHAYDTSEDRWRGLPEPPGKARGEGLARLSAYDGRVYTLGPIAVQVLDLAKGDWSALPVSPAQPRLESHYVTATPEGVVVVGLDSTQPNDGIKPSYLLAEVWDGESWRRLERSDMLGGYGGWHWTGERLVSLYLGCMDGGEVNGYGRCIPTGGILDPGTGTWASLPDAPAEGSGGWSLNAAEGSRMVSWGYLYDDRTGRWTKVPRPAGAPRDGTAAVWAAGTLIAFGGVDWETPEPRLSNRAWAWTP